MTALLLALALAVGGAGLSFPMLQMVLGIFAIGVAASLVLTRRNWRFDKLSMAAIGLVAAVVLLPLIQLVPLPPEIWQSLPGRALPTKLDSILTISQWRPLSLDIEATVRAFLILLPAFVMFVSCMFLRTSERAPLLWVILGFALFNALLGIMQFTTGGRLTPYPSGHQGYAIGLFVNRNHSAVLALLAMPIAATLGRMQIARGRPRMASTVAILSALTVLAMAALGTTSRMALLLLPFAVATALFLAFHRQPPWRIALPSLAAVGVFGMILFFTGGFDRTLVRFSSLNDPRLNYWADIEWALRHYGLAGTGFGTFIPVYQSAESLDAVVPAITNHAHNDYLEIILDGGLPAIALLLLFLGLFGLALYRRAKFSASAHSSSVAIAAASGTTILLLSSLVDYPLRMPALSCVFAVLCALIFPDVTSARSIGREVVTRDRRPHSTLPSISLSLPRLGALMFLAALLSFVVQAGMSSRAILDGRYDAAIRWASWSTAAHERRASGLLLGADPVQSLPDAFAAVQLSPISGPAIRTIGLVRTAQGKPDQGAKLMGLAVILGWRDVLTQLWAMQAADSSGEEDKALQRAEALFRQENAMLPAIAQILGSVDREASESHLVRRLAQRPSWRKAFFKAAAGLPPTLIDRFTSIVDALGQTAAPVSPDEIEPLIERLTDAGQAQLAQRVWQSARRRNLISNGNFEHLANAAGSSGPIWWEIDPTHRLTVQTTASEAGDGGYSLRTSTAGTTAQPVVSQPLMLVPGAYTLRLNARLEAGGSAGVGWALRCRHSSVRQAGESPIGADGKWHQFAFSLAVPQQDCLIQTLAITAKSDTRKTEIRLDNVRLDLSTR